MVTTRDLSEYDEFRLDDADYALVGQHTGQKFRMGDKVRIKVVAANLEKRQLDYHWVPEVKHGRPVTTKRDAKKDKQEKNTRSKAK